MTYSFPTLRCRLLSYVPITKGTAFWIDDLRSDSSFLHNLSLYFCANSSGPCVWIHPTLTAICESPTRIPSPTEVRFWHQHNCELLSDDWRSEEMYLRPVCFLKFPQYFCCPSLFSWIQLVMVLSAPASFKLPLSTIPVSHFRLQALRLLYFLRLQENL